MDKDDTSGQLERLSRVAHELDAQLEVARKAAKTAAEHVEKTRSKARAVKATAKRLATVSKRTKSPKRPKSRKR